MSEILNINPVLLGGVRHDVKLQESVLRQKPLLELFPESNAAQDIGTLADRILKIYARMEPHWRGRNLCVFWIKIRILKLKVLTYCYLYENILKSCVINHVSAEG